MLSVCSSDPGDAWRPPPQAHESAAAVSMAQADLEARQLRMNPFVELPDDILLRHHHAAHVRRGAQPPLVELAYKGVLGHHQVGEIDYVAHVESRARQRLRRE